MILRNPILPAGSRLIGEKFSTHSLVKYQGISQVGSTLAGRVSSGRARVTRPDPAYFFKFLTRRVMAREDVIIPGTTLSENIRIIAY